MVFLLIFFVLNYKLTLQKSYTKIYNVYRLIKIILLLYYKYIGQLNKIDFKDIFKIVCGINLNTKPRFNKPVAIRTSVKTS